MGKGMGVLQNLQNFRVRVWKCHRTSRSSGYCGTVVHESQKFRASSGRVFTEVPGGNKKCCTRTPIIMARVYRIHRSSGCGYEYPTELTDVSGTGMKVLQNFQKFRVLWHGRKELTEVPGTGMNVLQNLQKFRVRIIPG